MSVADAVRAQFVGIKRAIERRAEARMLLEYLDRAKEGGSSPIDRQASSQRILAAVLSASGHLASGAGPYYSSSPSRAPCLHIIRAAAVSLAGPYAHVQLESDPAPIPVPRNFDSVANALTN
jgi:hypothetical protein